MGEHAAGEEGHCGAEPMELAAAPIPAFLSGVGEVPVSECGGTDCAAPTLLHSAPASGAVAGLAAAARPSPAFWSRAREAPESDDAVADLETPAYWPPVLLHHVGEAEVSGLASSPHFSVAPDKVFVTTGAVGGEAAGVEHLGVDPGSERARHLARGA
mmetsp:Transcript_107962/g.187422  ORF Transcript_107962/g.187422 Transcript_107962/m.187422 type:complete len:158 (-) Transcript_107962:520-993(-)